MTIKELNQAISKCNPYTEKPKMRDLQKQKRQLLKRINQSVSDCFNGSVPAMLKRQSGL